MRRAFVMPVVVLLALIASLTVAVLLNRDAVRHLDAEDELASYIDEHRQRGVRELIALWLQFSGQQDLEALISDDGLVFTLDYSGGRELRVWLIEAQSAPLVEPQGLDPQQPSADVIPLDEQRNIAERTAIALGGRAELVGRTAGPLAVSLASASDETIRALSLAVVQNEAIADEYANQLIRFRNERTEYTRPELLNLARDAGIADDLQTRLAALWTTLPSLWSVRAELVGPGQAGREEVVARYEATVFIPREQTTSALLTGSEHPSAWFLEWKKLDEGVGYTPVPGAY